VHSLDPLAAAGRCNEPGEFIGREGTTVVPSVKQDVQPRQMCQRVQRRAVVADEPAGELLGRLQVVVVGLGTQPVAAQPVKEL